MLLASRVRINGLYTDEYGIRPKERIEVPTAERDVEHIEIRGRHGSLTKVYGYKDIQLLVRFYMIDKDNFKPIFRKAKMNLLNAKKLIFDDDNEIFYKVKSVRIDAAENIIKTFGEFDVEFILAPFQFEESEPITITQETTLTNEGYESEPYIKAHATGTGKLYINGQIVTIKDINGFIEIDSELMNAYRKADGYITNLNNHMIGDFPVLSHGKNVIKFDGDITKLEINPRWRWV